MCILLFFPLNKSRKKKFIGICLFTYLLARKGLSKEKSPSVRAHLQRPESLLQATYIVWKVSKYGVFSGPYFLVFGMNTEIYDW